MKIPLNWLKEYVKTNKTPKEIAESFTYLGLLLDKPIEKVAHIDVLDLEHRMDRADWLGIIGCARDLAAYENTELILPEIDLEQRPFVSDEDKVEVNVVDSGFVNRFYTRVIKNVRVEESPTWLKERLEAYGLPSINNVVDITNYVMVELGQPMHAHDLDKMETKDITFRKAKSGEKIKTLLGETIELDESVFITTNNDKPTGIGGIVGGVKVAIDETTKNIVLDSGNYDQTIIRKTSRKLKIQNETVLRDDKFLHPYNNELAIKRATKLIQQLCGDEVEVFENGDYFPEKDKWIQSQMKVTLERIKKISGQAFDSDEVKSILERLDYKLLKQNESWALFEVPYFRTDVEVEDDLVADVLRIKSYKNILPTPIAKTPPQEITPNSYRYENKLRDILVNIGLHEHITDPLVQATDGTNQIKLENALNAEKSALRTTIAESLVPVLDIYKKHKKECLGIFEVGLIYTVSTEKVSELEKIKDAEIKREEKTELGNTRGDKQGIEYKDLIETKVVEVLTYANEQTPYEQSKKTKQILATLLHELGVEKLDYKVEDKSTFVYVDEKMIASVRFDGFSIFTKNLMQTKQSPKRVTSEFLNLSWEDITIVVKQTIKFGDIYNEIYKADECIKNVIVVSEYIDEELAKENNKSVQIRIEYVNNNNFYDIKENLMRTLVDKFNVSLKQ